MTLFDKKAGRRRYLANLEERKMLARYEDECVNYPTSKLTSEKLSEINQCKEAKQRERQRWGLYL